MNKNNMVMLRHCAFFAIGFLPLIPTALAQTDQQVIEKQLASGQHRQALAQLDKLLSGDRGNPHLLFYRARALAAGGRYDQAIKQYEALIKAEPKLPEAYNNLAAIYLHQGKEEQASQLLNKAMSIHPAYATLYRNLTTLNTRKAQDAYAKALQIQGKRQVVELQMADRLSLPDRQPAAGQTEARQTAAVTQATVRPDAAHQAGQNQADKKSETRAAREQSGFSQARAMLRAWARAWATKNADDYLQFYSENYSPAGMSRREWAEQRRERILRPKWIRVRLRNIRLKEQRGQQLTIYLEQEYRADNYSDVTRKEFVVEEVAGAWRINKERGLGYLTR